MHGREANAEVDRGGGVALIVKADAARFDVHVTQCVWVGYRLAVSVHDGLEAEGVVEN